MGNLCRKSEGLSVAISWYFSSWTCFTIIFEHAGRNRAYPTCTRQASKGSNVHNWRVGKVARAKKTAFEETDFKDFPYLHLSVSTLNLQGAAYLQSFLCQLILCKVSPVTAMVPQMFVWRSCSAWTMWGVRFENCTVNGLCRYPPLGTSTCIPPPMLQMSSNCWDLFGPNPLEDFAARVRQATKTIWTSSTKWASTISRKCGP